MSEEVKLNLTRIGVVLGVLAGTAAIFGTFFVLPYRMAAAEKAIQSVQDRAETDHDLIQRIDERTMRIEKAVDRLAK